MTNRIMCLFGVSVVMLVSTLCASIDSLSGDLEVIGRGKGTHESKALLAAKHDAIDRAIIKLLLYETEQKRYKKKRLEAITKNISALKNYTIKDQGKDSSGSNTVVIKALVSRLSLKQGLATFKITLESIKKPKVMVLVMEDNVDIKHLSSRAAEIAIGGYLQDPFQFELIDPAIVSSVKTSAQKMGSLAKDATNAATLGAMYGAEIIVTGYVTSAQKDEVSDKPGGIQFVQAEVSLRAINCTTGEVLASGEAEETQVHISPKIASEKAIATASLKIIQKITPPIVEGWAKQVEEGIPLNLFVKGVQTIRVKNIVMQTVKDMIDVTQVTDKGWNEANKTLSLAISFRGSINDFCTKSNGYKMNSRGGSFAVTGQRGTDISVLLQSK